MILNLDFGIWCYLRKRHIQMVLIWIRLAASKWDSFTWFGHTAHIPNSYWIITLHSISDIIFKRFVWFSPLKIQEMKFALAHITRNFEWFVYFLLPFKIDWYVVATDAQWITNPIALWIFQPRERKVFSEFIPILFSNEISLECAIRTINWDNEQEKNQLKFWFDLNLSSQKMSNSSIWYRTPFFYISESVSFWVAFVKLFIVF